MCVCVCVRACVRAYVRVCHGVCLSVKYMKFVPQNLYIYSIGRVETLCVHCYYHCSAITLEQFIVAAIMKRLQLVQPFVLRWHEVMNVLMCSITWYLPLLND